jgi:phospholipid/cholesterol/gamma-HCH transport system substrate-binding protein
MPRTRSAKWSELKIGIMAVIAVVVAAALILTLSGQGGFWWQRYTLKAKFSNAAGVLEGSPVRVAGVPVGSVTAIRFVGPIVEMDLEVRKDMQERIRTTSTVTIGSVSLLGEGAVDISPATTGEPIPPRGYIPAGEPPAQISDVTTQANKGISELTKLITDIRQGKGTAGKLMTDEQLYSELSQLTTAARQVTDGLSKGKGTLGELLNNPEAARQLEVSMRNLTAITEKINKGQGSLGQLMNDPALAKNVTDMTANLNNLTANLNQGRGTMGKLMTDEVLYQRFNAVTTNLETLLSNLNKGQGTMGRLMNDQALYENINKVMTNVNTLVDDIRKDPKKFLNMKMSIF